DCPGVQSPALVDVAAFNSPDQVVVSGDLTRLEQLARYCQSQGIKTAQLAVSHAFHSRLMDPMLAEFKKVTATVTYRIPKYAFVSNVTGKMIKKVDADYWVSHARSPVHFQQEMQTLKEAGCSLFLEVGPKPVLLGLGAQCLDAPE